MEKKGFLQKRIRREKDDVVRGYDIYLFAKPVDVLKNTPFNGKPKFNHWSLVYKFEKTENSEERTIGCDLDKKSKKIPINIVRYGDVNKYQLKSKYTLIFSRIQGLEMPDGSKFDLKDSPKNIKKIAGELDIIGKIYKGGTRNCQDFVVKMLQKHGISKSEVDHLHKVRDLALVSRLINGVFLIKDLIKSPISFNMYRLKIKIGYIEYKDKKRITWKYKNEKKNKKKSKKKIKKNKRIIKHIIKNSN
eukprot:TRINITY_DN8115_c0_g1_i1.p1 TRINITY_DN8115_c0_g1~~TRINITY_DN8115_c0_g1_i1.p1  ORF type:complete len:247 (-),score=46.84 TRINITY_DN8115_c0_g1_i1:9-749(-)